jgi:DNA-binding NarL/FixJ family response regulator
MISVAIVEDNEGIRNSMQAILDGTKGFQCPAVFTNAEEAAVRLPLLPHDVIIMDIGLPGMTGIECLKQVRHKIPDTQILMFTIYEDEQQIFEALMAGANGYLLKRTPPAQMLEAIREVIEGGSPMSPSIARKVVSFFKTAPQANEAKSLTTREKEVLDYLSRGFLYKEIAEKLSIATGTVKRHLHSIYEKLHVQNKTEALNKVYPKHSL